MPEEKIYDVNKTADLLGKPFKVISEPQKCLETGYDYAMKYRTKLIFKEQDGKFMRYDREQKQFVEDDFNNYWYEDKYGKKRNYVNKKSRFLIQFKEPSNISTWVGEVVTKKVDKAYIKFSGNGEFGQTKRLLSKLKEVEAMGHNRDNVYVRMEKDGIAYTFVVDSIDKDGDTSSSSTTSSTTADNSSVTSINRKLSQELIDAIETMKEKNFNKDYVWEVLTNPEHEANLPHDTAMKIMDEHFGGYKNE